MRLKQKISYKEWTEIGIYNSAAKWLRPLCSYTLIKEPDGRFKREQRVNIFIYILLFIPVCILQLLLCCWDGGIKEFEFPKLYLGEDWFTCGTIPYERSQTVWCRYH